MARYIMEYSGFIGGEKKSSSVKPHVEETKKYNICLKAYADSQKLQ